MVTNKGRNIGSDDEYLHLRGNPLTINGSEFEEVLNDWANFFSPQGSITVNNGKLIRTGKQLSFGLVLVGVACSSGGQNTQIGSMLGAYRPTYTGHWQGEFTSPHFAMGFVGTGGAVSIRWASVAYGNATLRLSGTFMVG